MRLKYVKNGHQILEESNFVITNPQEYQERWKDIFGNDNPIHGEFGAGRGGFSVGMAEQYPDINFLAFERNTKVIVKGLGLLEEKKLPNVFFIHQDVRKTLESFGEGFFSRIYLNFSDPWPKKKHTDRRLTDSSFLKNYELLLKKDGDIVMKTDNKTLFFFSKEMFLENEWSINRVEENLHQTDLKDFNIMTEYESKFVSQGINIYYIHAQKPQKNSIEGERV